MFHTFSGRSHASDGVGTALIGMEGLRLLLGATLRLDLVDVVVGTALIGMEELRLGEDGQHVRGEVIRMSELP